MGMVVGNIPGSSIHPSWWWRWNEPHVRQDGSRRVGRVIFSIKSLAEITVVFL